MSRPPSLRRAALFLALFVGLQLLWGKHRGTAIERAIIDGATVGTAVALIDALTPAVNARAEGARIRAAGGGLNIRNGCEGLDIAFLMIAGILALPMPPKRRVTALALGILLAFALNQARVLALFYANRSDRALFELLHGTLAPVVLVAAAVLFLACLARAPDPASPAA